MPDGRKVHAIETLRAVVAELNARGEGGDPERVNEELARRLGGVVLKLEPEYIPMPFAVPPGFQPPLARDRYTRRQIEKEMAGLASPRPTTRRAALMGIAPRTDLAEVRERIEGLSRVDPDPYVRGLAILTLGAAGLVGAVGLMAAAESVVAEAATASHDVETRRMRLTSGANAVLGVLAAGAHDKAGMDAVRPAVGRAIARLRSNLDARDDIIHHEQVDGLLATLRNMAPDEHRRS